MRIVISMRAACPVYHQDVAAALFPAFQTDYWWRASYRYPLPEEDPRTQKLLEQLKKHNHIHPDEDEGPKPWPHKRGFRRREYDLNDLAAAEYFYLVEPLLENGHRSAGEPDTLPPLAIWAHNDRTFSVFNGMFLARTYGVKVLEREAPVGLTLHPVKQYPLGAFREARIEEDVAGEARFAPMATHDPSDTLPIESKLFRRIDSNITLPQLPEDIVVPCPNPPEAEAAFTLPPRAIYPIEPAYKRSDLNQLGPFDIARLHERLLGEQHPGLVISKRLYQVLRQYHMLADVIPVRIIED